MNENIELLRKYNFWDTNSKIGDSLGYIREQYTHKLASYTGNKLVKVLLGQRRVGKSYILRQVAKQLINNGVPAINTLFINRELVDFNFLTSDLELHALIKQYLQELKPSGRIYLFIDEIQEIKGWERVINSYSQDYTKDFEIFISGSNSKMLSGELATLLSGRYICLKILPFSFYEYIGITGKEKCKQNYIEYLNSGGLPELFSISEIELKYNYVSAVKDTVLLKDIIQRYSIREPKLLEDIFIFLVNNAANLISITSIVKYFKGLGRKAGYDVVSTYIGYIEDVYLIHRADRYDIKGKDTISGNAKYYINDLAYKNYLYSGYGYGTGYKLENLVYLELIRLGYKVYVGNIKGKEVDFVAMKGERIVYIQSTYILLDETTIVREYSPLESIPDNYEKIVVSLDDIALPLRGGIKHILAWNIAEEL